MQITGTLESAAAQQAAKRTRSGPDRCPTTTARHEAKDGQILRVRLPGGRLTPPQAWTIAGLAGDGSGDRNADRIELTSRGNLQVRGSPQTPRPPRRERSRTPASSRAPEHERARTILASPLFGRTEGAAPLTDAFVTTIDEAICVRRDTTAISGRVLTVVDDGTGHSLARTPTSARRRPGHRRPRGRRHIRRAVPVADAPERARRCSARWPRRARRTVCGGHVSCPPAPWLTARRRPQRPHGRSPSGQRACAPLPRAAAGRRPRPARRSRRRTRRRAAGSPDGRHARRRRRPRRRVRDPSCASTHERGVTLVDLPALDDAEGPAGAALRALQALGLITSQGDPRLGLTACAGEDCTRTTVDVRAARHACAPPPPSRRWPRASRRVCTALRRPARWPHGGRCAGRLGRAPRRTARPRRHAPQPQRSHGPPPPARRRRHAPPTIQPPRSPSPQPRPSIPSQEDADDHLREGRRRDLP